MKIVIPLYDPEGIDAALHDAAKEMVPQHLSHDEYEEEVGRAWDKLVEDTLDVIECQAFVYLEFDTETKQVRIKPRSEW